MAEDMAQSGWGAEMAAEEHISTYESFIKGSKWGVVLMVVLLSLMAFFLL